MAANARSKAATWAKGDKVLNTHFETVDANGGRAVSRDTTTGGTINYPLAYGGSNSVLNVGLYYSSSGGTLVTDTVAYIVVPLDRLPHGHDLESVAMSLTPAGGHGGTPAALPSIKVQKITTAGVVSNLGTATYSWVDTATYQAGFVLTATCGSERIELSTSRYQLFMTVESGGNSVSGTRIESMKVDMTMDTASAGADMSFWR